MVLYLLHDATALYALTPTDSAAVEFVRMELEGGRPNQPGVPEEPLGSVTNFYAGHDPDAWRPGLPNYQRVRFPQVYPGVDLAWHGRRGELEYEFSVAPGAEPSQIRLRFRGCRRIWIDHAGDLVVETAAGELRWRRPRAYAITESERRPVAASFRLKGDVVTFSTGRYDRQHRLVIDPVLSFSSYLGGAGFDAGYAVAVDSSGNIYVTGETASADFPVPAGRPSSARANRDAFATKLSADGSTVLYTTILSGGGNDSGRAIAVDGSGNAYLAGVAGGSGFPTTSGALRTSPAGLEDAFVTKLGATGSLLYSTYLGEAGTDVATGVAVDAAGSAYVAGYTASLRFPTTAGAAQTSHRGGYYDAFVAKLNPQGSALAYSTLLGGRATDLARAVAVAASGNACVAGYSDSTDLPVRNAVQASVRSGGDALVGCLNSAGTTWNYLTYLGGASRDEAYALAIDVNGNVYLTGATASRDFPVTTGATKHGSYDAFLAKLNPAGSALVYSTLLGGSDADTATAMAVDGSGRAWVAGFTSSVDFPLQASWQTAQGGFDAFVCQVDATGASLLVSSYLGGSADDRATGLARDGSGSILVAGFTASTDFPTTAGGLQPVARGPYNAFVARISDTFSVAVSPSSGAGASQTFAFTFTDTRGAGNISAAKVLFGASVSEVGACLASYARSSNSISLRNDAGTAWLGPTPLGTAGVLQNGQCTLALQTATASVIGNSLALTLPISFSSSFGGQKSIYLQLVDQTGASSGWQAVGTWQVPGGNAAPVPVSVSPSSGSGTSQTFSFTYSDADGAQDISAAEFLFNRELNSVGACAAYYESSSDSLYLLNDAATAWLGPGKLGAAVQLQNSQCFMALQSASASAVANNRVLTVPVSFSSASAGAKNTYLRATDRAGAQSAWSALGTWTVPAAGNWPPTVVSVTPSSGSGSSRTFSFVYSDPNGYADLPWVQVNINSALSAVNACYIHYARAPNAVWVLNDTVTAWLGPVFLGTATGVSNGQCVVSAASSSASGSGNNLTVNLTLGFQPAFAGTKTIYMQTQDITGFVSTWQAKGSWTVAGSGNEPPTVVSVSPSSGSGSSRTFSLVYSDPNGYADLPWVQVNINSALNAVNACYIHYARAANAVWVLNDAASAWLGPVFLGTAASTSNSQCVVNAATSSASGSGNNLTLNLALDFRSAFAGAKTVHMQTADDAGLLTGWQAKGTWTVP